VHCVQSNFIIITAYIDQQERSASLIYSNYPIPYQLFTCPIHDFIVEAFQGVWAELHLISHCIDISAGN
jgi:hypothetical protein